MRLTLEDSTAIIHAYVFVEDGKLFLMAILALRSWEGSWTNYLE